MMLLDHQIEAFMVPWLCEDERTYHWIKERLSLGKLIRAYDSHSHFAVYFLPYRPSTREVFMVYHKKANLWIAPGGHIEPEETLLDTLNREIQEELGMTDFFPLLECPFMLSITRINNLPVQKCRMHYDMWFLMNMNGLDFKPEMTEFHAAMWMTFDRARAMVTEPHNRSAISLLEKSAFPEIETPEMTAERLSRILSVYTDKRVCVVGTTCTGKSELTRCIPGTADMDDLIFPLLTPAETGYVSQSIWSRDIGIAMSRLVKERVTIIPGQPVFGTVVIPSDLIVLLDISRTLLAERVGLRGESMPNALGMQRSIREEVRTSGIPYILFPVG